jgi:hypothetical protein
MYILVNEVFSIMVCSSSDMMIRYEKKDWNELKTSVGLVEGQKRPVQ